MGKRSILTLVLLGTVLQGESLSNRILVLEGMKRTVNESGELSIDYILAGRHAKAAEQARLLFPVKREWGQLFNEAFCRSILKDPVADRAWRDFSMLDRKEKPAKRWLDLAKAAQEAHVRGSFSDEKAWIEEIRQIYQGRGAAAYRTLGDSANETAMHAKVAKIDNTVSEMRSSSRCGGFSVATPQSQGRNNAKPAKVSAADCATMMNYWKKIDHDAKGQNNVRADVAVARMEMMSAGVCNDTRYKPDLRECATASLRWAEANVSEQEIKRRLKVANCAQP